MDKYDDYASTEYLFDAMSKFDTSKLTGKIVHISTPYGPSQSWIRRMFMCKDETRPADPRNEAYAEQGYTSGSNQSTGHGELRGMLHVSLRQRLLTDRAELSNRLKEINYILENLTPEAEIAIHLQNKLRMLGYPLER